MAKQQLDVLQPHENKNTGKTYWNRLGTAYENANGSYTVNFNSLPIPTYDEQYGMQVRVILKPQLDKKPNDNPNANGNVGGGYNADDFGY